MEIMPSDQRLFTQARTLIAANGPGQIRDWLKAEGSDLELIGDALYPAAFGNACSMMRAMLGIIDHQRTMIEKRDAEIGRLRSELERFPSHVHPDGTARPGDYPCGDCID